jgi:hypothetical protein
MSYWTFEGKQDVGEGVINHNSQGTQHTFFSDVLGLTPLKGELDNVNVLRHFDTTRRQNKLLLCQGG